MNPHSLLHVGQIQVEAYFIFILVLLLLAMLRYMKNSSWIQTLCFSFVLGLTTLSREMGFYFVVLCLPAILYPLFKKGIVGFKQDWTKIAILILTPILVILGWAARNYQFYNYYIWTTHTAFMEAWYFTPKVMAAAWKVTEEEARLKILAEVSAQYPEYRRDYESLEEDSLYYWKFNHRVELNERSVPGYCCRLLVKYWPTTISTFIVGAFWSFWSGIGEWRGILISPNGYKELAASGLVNKAKSALFRFEFFVLFQTIGKILTKFSISVYFVFGYIWLLMVLLAISALWGIIPMWRVNAVFTIELIGMIAFAGVMSGPAANNRLLALAYPLISLLSAEGLLKLESRWKTVVVLMPPGH